MGKPAHRRTVAGFLYFKLEDILFFFIFGSLLHCALEKRELSAEEVFKKKNPSIAERVYLLTWLRVRQRLYQALRCKDRIIIGIVQMKYKKFVRLYSYSRVFKYYKATDGNKHKAMQLYYANVRIAQAFHPLLGAFEVILRNQLHYALARHFSDGSWIVNQKSGFMSAPSLVHIDKKSGKRKVNNYLLKEVENAERKIRDKGVAVTAGRVIAEQNLGFWNSLYEKHHYILLAGTPCTIFQSLPSGYGRKEVNETITKIRELRNRINHNEPICFVDKKRDFSYVRDMYQKIMDFLSWIDSTIPASLAEVDKVLGIIDKEEKKQLS